MRNFYNIASYLVLAIPVTAILGVYATPDSYIVHALTRVLFLQVLVYVILAILVKKEFTWAKYLLLLIFVVNFISFDPDPNKPLSTTSIWMIVWLALHFIVLILLFISRKK